MFDYHVNCHELSLIIFKKEEKLQKTTFQEMCDKTKFEVLCESCLEFFSNTSRLSSLGASEDANEVSEIPSALKWCPWYS